MSPRLTRPFDDVSRRWLALAERRRCHVIELRDSGRWRHYYSRQELELALREVTETRDRWAQLAGGPITDHPITADPIADNPTTAGPESPVPDQTGASEPVAAVA
jgi:hypothetical protein